MKVCQSSRPALSGCRSCSKVFPSALWSARHQVRDHQDTWAVIDLMEAGMTDTDAGRLYDKSIKQAVKTFGSYYTRTKVRRRKTKNQKCENIKLEKKEATEDDGANSNWIVDDNIDYDSNSDGKQDEEDKRSSREGHFEEGMKGIEGKMDGHQN